MRGGGDVGGPMKPKKMKDGGGLKDMSGDGKITQRDRIMAARGEKPVKKNMGGKVSKKAGVMKRNMGGKVSKKAGVMKRNMGGKVSKKAGVMKRMRGGPINKKK